LVLVEYSVFTNPLISRGHFYSKIADDNDDNYFTIALYNRFRNRSLERFSAERRQYEIGSTFNFDIKSSQRMMSCTNIPYNSDVNDKNFWMIIKYLSSIITNSDWADAHNMRCVYNEHFCDKFAAYCLKCNSVRFVKENVKYTIEGSFNKLMEETFGI